MKHHLGGLLVLSVLLAGCSSLTPKDTSTPAPGESAIISEEEFNKIPKNLRPEELERRNDTTVVIRPGGDDRTIKEYRVGGFLYAIHVTPKIGPPYYLVAADNKGNFMCADQPGILVPSWTIFTWK